MKSVLSSQGMAPGMVMLLFVFVIYNDIVKSLVRG